MFLVGVLADLLGRHSPLPRVTVLLIAGFVIGPSGFDVLPVVIQDWFPVLTNIALAMVGFLLGQKLAFSSLKELGQSVFGLSLGKVTTAAILTGAGLVLFGAPLELALLLAGIAPATAPAATLDVVREIKAKGKFTDTLLDVVAIDDAWGLMLFSLLLAAAHMLSGQGEASEILLAGLWEVAGAILLGVAIGFPMSFLTGRILPGEPTQAEALGWVLLCSGVAVWMGASYILATIVLGVVVANFATHPRRPFHAI
ncbi:MAG: cation:proton antiporter, partial [Rhodospirillales bacterium]|nr:cation:proton antiporter [Rhodospirillales bacterium]